MNPDSVTAIDIGTKTQDIVVYAPGQEIENAFHLVIPSPTRRVADRIREATRLEQSLFLSGTIMGGGPMVKALARHLEAGLEVFAAPHAALTVHDDPDRVEQMGIRITDSPPDGAARVVLGDVDMEGLRRLLREAGISPPERLLVAAQDHGHSPSESNRRFRFRWWEGLIGSGGHMHDMLHLQAPEEMTRLRAIQGLAEGSPVMDSGAAALWGIMGDREVARASGDRGVLAVNVGNSHIVAALIRTGRVWGVMEHHTRQLDPPRLYALLQRLREGRITLEEVFDSGGHGAAISPDYPGPEGFDRVALIGPRRREFWRPGVIMAHPHGHMMLAGCYGLLTAAGYLLGREGDGEFVSESS